MVKNAGVCKRCVWAHAPCLRICRCIAGTASRINYTRFLKKCFPVTPPSCAHRNELVNADERYKMQTM
eukprot:3695038-Amphidinium_carterae.1